VRLLLGIDIGTQGTKTALYAEDGACLAERFCASQPHRPASGVVEENPETQLTSVLQTIRECLAQSRADPAAVAGLAIVGQMAGVIGIGADGRAVTPYDSWLDTRCGAYVEKMRALAGDEVLAKTGNAPSFNHGPKKLWWKHERPADYARVRAFVQPAAYIAMRLCNLDAARAFIDYTYLHFSGFADNRRLAWDEGLCRSFEIDPAKLPAIVAPHSMVGHVSDLMARECGLRADTPVVAGCGDTAASFLACGATDEGVCVDVAGTASVFAATTRKFVPDTKSHTLGCGRSVLAGWWHPYAYVNGGGQNLEWFRRAILGEQRTLDELGAEASDDSHDEGLPFFVPHLGGRVSPAWPGLRGSWVGLSWDASVGTMFRAMLEGVALEYALYQRALRLLLPRFELREVRVTGGGERSPVWNQLKADRLQARVVGLTRCGGAPMGAALLAGYGTGVFPDLAEVAKKWIELGRAFEPDPAKAALSEHRIQRYAALLDKLHAWTVAP